MPQIVPRLIVACLRDGHCGVRVQDQVSSAGVPGRIPHDFRRTAVRNLERAGIARSAAMKMTGHKTESIYRRYAIVDEAMLKESASKLAAFHADEKNRTRNVVSMKRRGSR